MLKSAENLASGGVYGYRHVLGDLREAGEACGKHRVAKIMRAKRIKAVRGYKAPRHIAGRPSILAPNRLQRRFHVDQPDQAWVTDITYLRTWQGWLYLAVVIDLHSRKVIGWSMKPSPGNQSGANRCLTIRRASKAHNMAAMTGNDSAMLTGWSRA